MLRFLFLLLAAGCALHRVEERPPPPVELPEAWAGGAEGAASPERWWLAFDEPALDALIERALGENLELRGTWARVVQAEALARQAGAARWPTVELAAEASRERLFFDIGVDQLNFTTSRFGVSAAAAYELDLWGRVRALTAASSLEARAAGLDVQAAATTLAAAVADSWFDLVAQRALVELLRRQLETNETWVRLVELRFREGLTPALDVLQQRQQAELIRAELATAEGQLATIEQQLAVLLGAAPGTIALPPGDELPSLPPRPAAGLPADLLHRRPDVLAARARVEAADHRIAAAIADRLPALRLTGSVGYNATSLGALFENLIWRVGGDLVAPLWDGGARAAEVDRSRGAHDEAVAGYGQTLLEAALEVEQSLALERAQLAFLDRLEATLDTARRALRAGGIRYLQGLTDYLPVLTSLQDVQQGEQQLLLARRQLLGYRLQLYRALGGTWPEELEPPKEAP